MHLSIRKNNASGYFLTSRTHELFLIPLPFKFPAILTFFYFFMKNILYVGNAQISG